MQKIIRTITKFTSNATNQDLDQLNQLKQRFQDNGFLVQTTRIATSTTNFQEIRNNLQDKEIRISLGKLTLEQIQELLPNYHDSTNINFNIELSDQEITLKHVQILFDLIKGNPANTFNFTYLFNGVPTPYFPSAIYEQEGFAVGLQPTDLSVDCNSLGEWFENMKAVWQEITELMSDQPDFLGIDSSIAPLFEGESSLINFINRLGLNFNESVTTDTYTQISNFIKSENPKLYGLNGLMMPCLEDFELADEYESGEFSIERNIFLSLHSGLGIDTYPMGIDESPERVLEILKLMQALSNKYKKPLSTRFVSDGKAKVGNMTDFQNQYLKDVVVQKL